MQRITTRILLAAVLGAVALVLAWTGTAVAFERFTFDQRYLVLPGRYVKDRCFARLDGRWHCFMIAGNDSVMDWRVPGNEISFAHASTVDFRHWTIHPDVIGTGTGEWDERNVWAPDVVPWGNGFRMYYTGVDSSVVQRMGMAESRDLFEWRPSAANPLYRPDTALFDWGEGRWSNCRDPDVIRIGDTLHVLHTVSTRDGRGAIDRAVSANGLAWIERGALFVNDTEAVVESVQLVERDGAWYLFFTEHGVLGVSVMRAESMLGPWKKDSRVVLSLGAAQEIFGDEPNTLIARHKSYWDGARFRNALKIDSLLWSGAEYPAIGDDRTLWEDWSPLRLDDPDPGFRETGFEILATDSAFAYQPTFGENPVFRGETDSIGAVGNSWIGTRERFRGPLTETAEGGLVGDAAVGGIRSRDFRISGERVSFLIGGTSDPERVRLDLRDAATHETILSATGTGSERLERRAFDVSAFYGRRVYLAIVDASAAGHLNLDEIVESGTPAPPADRPFPGYLFDPYPNPFNGASAALLRLDADARVEVTVSDAAGRVVRTILSGRLEMGYRRLEWDGADGRGRPAAPGVYFLRVAANGRALSKKLVLVR